ncbi:MAG TPA: DUF4097 family beta strand repeat-containing protein [Candidatus Synoicihabitans sp.]|nr:DUF4097 family beta strand repeat-containing protein [Candidatus Synoicihabitans sp.]
MNLPRFALLAGLAALSVVSAQARIERVVEKTFNVAPGGTLTVSTHGGEVKVEPGQGNGVKVVARQTFPRADSEAEADEILRDLEFSVEQSGNDVSAHARYQKRGTGGWWGGGRPAVSVAFTVTVPSTYNVDLATSGGNITVGDLTGTAKVRTSGGDLRFGRFRGPVDGRTSGGNIIVAEAADRVNLSTSGGDIRVERVTGEVELSTSGGNISIESVRGSLNASTSGGNVSAGIDGPVTKDVSLSTSGGNVTARVAKDAAFRLEAKTSGGSVRADGLTITLDSGGSGRSKLAGTVNGGGPLVKLRTSGGDVTVATR